MYVPGQQISSSVSYQHESNDTTYCQTPTYFELAEVDESREVEEAPAVFVNPREEEVERERRRHRTEKLERKKRKKRKKERKIRKRTRVTS